MIIFKVIIFFLRNCIDIQDLWTLIPDIILRIYINFQEGLFLQIRQIMEGGFQVCFLLFLAQNKNIPDKKFRGTQVTKVNSS